MEFEGHQIPKWAPLAAGAAVLGFLVLRARSAGGASISPAADPLSGPAGQLQQQALQQRLQQQGALAGLQTQIAGAQQEYQAGFGFLTAGGTKSNNPLVGCPGGGEARFVPNPGSPLGWSWECIPKSQKGPGVLGYVQAALSDALAVFGAVNGPARGGTPPIAGGSSGSSSPQRTGDTTGGYPPGYVPTTV